MQVSYIIRTFNEERYLPELLGAINKQKRDFDQEVIVIDSGSTDSTKEIAKYFGAKLTSIKKEEFSFGRSLNKAIALSDASFCIIVSAHCIPSDENWAAGLVAPLVANTNAAVCYGRQIGGPTTKISEHQIFKSWFPESFGEESLARTGFCNNANAAIRRALWVKSRYDESLTGLEDLSWAEAMMKLGHEIVYQPRAVVVHHHDETWPQVENRYFREAIALKKIRPHLRATRAEVALLFLRHVYSDVVSYKGVRSVFSAFKEVAMFRYYQFKGMYKGINKRDKVSEELKKKFYY